MFKPGIYMLAACLIVWQAGCAQSIKPVAPVTSPQVDTSFHFTRFVPGDFVDMEVDMLGNLYLLSRGYQLKKIKPNGDSVGVFNDVKKYGNPSYIDVSNPFKVLVYYKNYSTAVILDRQLTPRNTLNFRKQNIFNVKAVTTSYDNNIWLFDEQDFKLKKINETGKVLLESTDMRLLVDSVPSPVRIIDSDDFVYLYDPLRGFNVFDNYGTLKNTLPFRNWRNVSVVKKVLFGFDDTHLYSYSLSSLDLKTYPLPPAFIQAQSIRVQNGTVYVLTPQGVQLFSVK